MTIVSVWISVVISNRVVFVGQDFRRNASLFGLQNGTTDGQGPLVTICVVRHDHSPSCTAIGHPPLSIYSPLLDPTAFTAQFRMCIIGVPPPH